MAKSIKVEIDTGKTLPLSYLEPLQGDLKELSSEAHLKLRRSILKHGFVFPFFVWDNPESGSIKIIDGHQRLNVLSKLKDDGYKIPQLPVVMIPAKTEDEAKEKLLAATSAFGKITQEGFAGFLNSFSFNTEDLFGNIEIPTIDFSALTIEKKEKETIEVEGYTREKPTFIEGEDDIPEQASNHAKLGHHS